MLMLGCQTTIQSQSTETQTLSMYRHVSVQCNLLIDDKNSTESESLDTLINSKSDEESLYHPSTEE